MAKAFWIGLFVVAGLLIEVCPAGSDTHCSIPGYDDRCERRARLVDSRMNAASFSVYVPRVDEIVAGGTVRRKGTDDFKVTAFDGRSGRHLWSRLYNGAARDEDVLTALSASRNGKRLYVAGYSRVKAGSKDWITMALSSNRGRVLWKSHYGARGWDIPYKIVQDPSASAIYVIGELSTNDNTTGVVAYDAKSGHELWARQRKTDIHAWALRAAEMNQGNLYLLEKRYCRLSPCKHEGLFLERSLPSRKGLTTKWLHRIPDADGDIDYVYAGFEPQGSHIFLAGRVGGYKIKYYVLRSRARVDGHEQWMTKYDVPSGSEYSFPILAEDPVHHQVIMGESSFTTPDHIAAFSASAGRKRWRRRYPTGNSEWITDIVSGRKHIYVTGTVSDQGKNHEAATTISLGPKRGHRDWTARYDETTEPGDGLSGYLRLRGGKLLLELSAPQNSKAKCCNTWSGVAIYDP